MPRIRKLKPAKKGSPRAPAPPDKYSQLRRHLHQERVREAAEKADEVISAALQKKVCGKCKAPDARPYRKKTGEAVDLHWLANLGMPAFKVRIVLASYAWRCETCSRELSMETATKTAERYASRLEALKASRKRLKAAPIIDSKAWRMARLYKYRAHREKDPYKRAKLYQRHFLWEAKAKKGKTE